jgi:hypothetical protein
VPTPDRRRTARTAATVLGAAALLVVTVTGCSSARTTSTDAVPAVHDMRSTPCGAASLAVAVGGRDGAALPSAPAPNRSTEVALVITNTGDEPCTLQGWPTVRYTTGGSVIGKEAFRVRAVPEPVVTLRPGTEVQAYLTMREDDSVASCSSGPPDGIEVLAPRTDVPIRAALPPALTRLTCVSDVDTVLSVQAVIPL